MSNSSLGVDNWVALKLRVLNTGGQPTPDFAHDGDSGRDVHAAEDIFLYPGETRVAKTGLHFIIPSGYEIQVRPRSGVSLKTKLRVANSPGTIDSNYHGELGVILDNISESEIKIKKGDRICQIVVQEVPASYISEIYTQAEFDRLVAKSKSLRGSAGYGSSGV